MDIQHKDIPDNNLHEVKGAASATEGTVLTANGDGTTSFKLIEPKNISLPVGSGTLTVGSGTFGVYTPAYGTIEKDSNTSASFLTGANSGLTLDGASVAVPVTGHYLVTVLNGLNIVGGNITYPTFRNRSLSQNIFTGLSAIVELEAGLLYDFSATQITYSVLQVKP